MHSTRSAHRTGVGFSQALPPHTRIVVSTTQAADTRQVALALVREPFPTTRTDGCGRCAILTQSMAPTCRTPTDAPSGFNRDGWILQPAGCPCICVWPSRRLASGIPTIPALHYRRISSGMVVQVVKPAKPGKNHGRVLVGRDAGGILFPHVEALPKTRCSTCWRATRTIGTISRQRVARHDLPARQLPPAIWLRLYQDLSPYLSWRSVGGTALFTFFHASFAAVAERWYPSGNWSDQICPSTNGSVFSEYGDAQASWTMDCRTSSSAFRAFVPTQLGHPQAQQGAPLLRYRLCRSRNRARPSVRTS